VVTFTYVQGTVLSAYVSGLLPVGHGPGSISRIRFEVACMKTETKNQSKYWRELISDAIEAALNPLKDGLYNEGSRDIVIFAKVRRDNDDKATLEISSVIKLR